MPHIDLAERIEAIERKHAQIATKPRSHGATKEGNQATRQPGDEAGDLAARNVLSTGLDEIDEALGGGLRAGLHEWYGTKDKFEIRNSKFENERQQGNEALGEATRQRGNKASHEGTETRRHEGKVTQPNRQLAIDNRQFVPLCLLVHLAWRTLEANPAKWVIWIGKECFPYPAVLVREAGRNLRLLRRSLFVRAESTADRVWAADLSIRYGLAGAVIADGSGLDMAATRRLQLAARSRETFVFLVRPPQDLDRLSAATTRWMVRTERQRGNKATRQEGGSHGATKPRSHEVKRQQGNEAKRQQEIPNPQWNIELLRCKGMQPTTSRRGWLVEWNRAANVIGVPTANGDSFTEQPRSHEATKPRRAMG